MKKIVAICALLTLVNVATLFLSPAAHFVQPVFAQTPTNGPFYFEVGPLDHTNCPLSTTSWQSIKGGGYQQVGLAAGVVFTFNGRKPDASGNIAPAAGDYGWPMIMPGPSTMTITSVPVTLK